MIASFQSLPLICSPLCNMSEIPIRTSVRHRRAPLRPDEVVSLAPRAQSSASPLETLPSPESVNTTILNAPIAPASVAYGSRVHNARVEHNWNTGGRDRLSQPLSPGNICSDNPESLPYDEMPELEQSDSSEDEASPIAPDAERTGVVSARATLALASPASDSDDEAYEADARAYEAEYRAIQTAIRSRQEADARAYDAECRAIQTASRSRRLGSPAVEGVIESMASRFDLCTSN